MCKISGKIHNLRFFINKKRYPRSRPGSRNPRGGTGRGAAVLGEEQAGEPQSSGRSTEGGYIGQMRRDGGQGNNQRGKHCHFQTETNYFEQKHAISER